MSVDFTIISCNFPTMIAIEVIWQLLFGKRQLLATIISRDDIEKMRKINQVN
jgi:hypothetical protein